MTFYKKHIWVLFIAFFSLSTALLVSASAYRWTTIFEDLEERQAHLVDLTLNASHSLLINQEVILEVVGRELLKDIDFTSKAKVYTELDRLIAIDSAIVAFGLAAPDGTIHAVSSNVGTENLPNLREAPQTRDTFLEALDSQEMVIGRSYLFAPISEWLIPIRKAIFDEKGQAQAVMTAGLRMKGASIFFNNQIALNDFNSIKLIRNYDGYTQFESVGANWPQTDYRKPVNMALLEALKSRLGSGVADQRIAFEFDYGTDSALVVARLDERFDLWVVSQTFTNAQVKDFLPSFIGFVIAFIVTQTALFLFFKNVTQAEARKDKALIYQATHDQLTGLPNRTYLAEAAKTWMSKNHSPFSLFYVDMDYFKNINDNFGHAFGDKVLQELSRRITQTITSEHIALRQGGDEFLVFAPTTDAETLDPLANQMLHNLSRPYLIDTLEIELGVSIGIAQYPKHASDLDGLLRAADIAMYEAKKSRNSFYYFADSLLLELQQKLLVEKELRNALGRNELYLVYQPQYLPTGQLYGAEVLLRWENQNLGSVSPVNFIPIAEATGLMPRIGGFVISKALADIGNLEQFTANGLRLSINISVRQLMEPDFIANFASQISDSKFPSDLITIEITESLFIDDLETVLPILNAVHQLGMQISIDDFGTGYSSLSMLTKLPVDELKIDKSFVDNILDDPISRATVQNIIAIGKNYNLTVVSEGVEEQRQVDLLVKMNCDIFQGYHFSKPLSLTDFKTLTEGIKTSS